jgi:predicted dinucleotide-binding enzyme
VGSALAQRLSDAKNRIYLGVRNPDNFKNKHLINNDGVTVHSVEDAVKAADVIIVASPASTTHELAKQIAPLVADKVILDATNAMFGAPKGYKSGFLALQDITKSPNIVKCFNSTFAVNMADPSFGEQSIDMFIAGSNLNAKNIATKLAKDVGFGEVYDCGDDDKVELVESITPFVVNLAFGQGLGPTFGIKLLRR